MGSAVSRLRDDKPGEPGCGHHGCYRPERERFATVATGITFVRTVAALVVLLLAAQSRSLPLLLVGLAIYWLGDIADGQVARSTDTETRWGAVLDIVSDRVSAGAYYIGFVWIVPHMWLPVAIFLFEFMVVDAVLSLAFLAWPVISPNYFYLVDRALWKWNWSKPAKAINSSAVALMLLLTRGFTGGMWIASVLAAALLSLKIESFARLVRRGLPVPAGCALTASGVAQAGHPSRAQAGQTSQMGT